MAEILQQLESVPAHLQYHLWCCAILNTFGADIAFNFETHHKILKSGKLIPSIIFLSSISCFYETDFAY